MPKEKITPDSIAEQLNHHKYEDLGVFLRKGVDWYSLAPSSILPREKVRAFVSSIDDEEVRLAVMRFLIKYAYDYFLAMAKEDTEIDFRVGISSIEDQEREALKKVDAFQKELNFQVDLIVSSGEFSGDKFHKQEEKIKTLEKEAKDLKDEKWKLHQEIATLKARIDELEHPERKHQIPNELRCEEFYHVITYLTNKGIVTPMQAPDSYYRNAICYHWNTSKVLFGYFVCKVCYLLELRTKKDHLMWKVFKLAFDNFGELEKQARDLASKNKNWESASSTKPDDAYIVDEAMQYCAAKMELSKKREGE